MPKTKAPTTTPSPHPSSLEQKEVAPADNPTSVFVGMVLDMSWRLAIVVLLPIILGFKLDDKLHTSPLLTICGFLLAMTGTGLVMWQTLQAANKVPAPKKEK